MAELDTNLSEEKLKLLLNSMNVSLGYQADQASKVTNMLIRETVKFRNKLKEETGEILTVGDTRVALEALGKHLEDGRLPKTLTPEQKALAQIWIDHLTLFGAT